ncbi:MAG: hypothetical protein FRX49_00026 [Trebouxia sp. A1-2]|nr:MAG: hypothetical protein FRX49_00026 [Trebouxia sp. A1-2]
MCRLYCKKLTTLAIRSVQARMATENLIIENNHTNKTLDHNTGAQLTKVINQFRQQVDQFLPDMYAWFDDSSLHVTIRALMG